MLTQNRHLKGLRTRFYLFPYMYTFHIDFFGIIDLLMVLCTLAIYQRGLSFYLNEFQNS